MEIEMGVEEVDVTAESAETIVRDLLLAQEVARNSGTVQRTRKSELDRRIKSIVEVRGVDIVQYWFDEQELVVKFEVAYTVYGHEGNDAQRMVPSDIIMKFINKGFRLIDAGNSSYTFSVSTEILDGEGEANLIEERISAEVGEEIKAV